MRRLGVLVTLLVVWMAGAQAQQWLAPGAFAGMAAGESGKHAAAQMQRAFPEQAAILRELSIESAETRAYQKDATSAKVIVFVFRDPTGSYGGFHLLRTPEMAASDLADLAALSDTRALLAFSNVVLLVEGAGLKSQRAELQALVTAVRPHATVDAGPFPLIGQYLPAGAIPATSKLALGAAGLENAFPTGKGDWLGFDMGAEAQVARYRLQGRESTLLLVAYPTPQVAMAREKALSRWFNVNKSEDVVEGRPVLYTRRIASLLAILADATSQKESEALLAKVNYGVDLTWNEPGHKATDPPFVETLYRLFLGTAYFGVFSLGIGIAFALFRLGVKRLMPGKIFDRPGSVEILQLGLGSKPIEGKDFYQ